MTMRTIDEGSLAKFRALVARSRELAEELSAIEKELTPFLESNDEPEIVDKDLEDIWAAEAERRLAEIVSGAVQTIPGDQVMAAMRAKYGA